MIGSPDLLAFTGAEGFGEARERAGELSGVPEELSVPLLPRAHPWAATSSALFLRDFILVAEFSEQVGPQPVLTIPDDPRILGAFDLNHFSLRIMSVDYQACSPGPSPSGPSPTGPAPRLSFCEDSRVVMGDWGSFAYVQHLTLYDLEARGFVRPFCLAYVSAEHRKLMEHFLLLSEGLGHASDRLKTGNRRAFARELTRKLLDLEYTRSVLQKESEAQSANELAGIERSILEHRDLLRQVTSFPNRKLKQPDFLPYDTYDPEPHPLTPPSPSYMPRLVKLPPSRRFDRRMKPLEELSDAYFLSLTLEQLAAVERRLRGDLPSLFTHRITQALTRKYPLNNFLFEPWNPEEGEELQGRDGGSSGEGLPVPECEGQGPPASLESFFSCVEELSIKLEIGSMGVGQGVEEEAGETMAGSVSSGDSIEVLGTEKSYRSQPVATDTGELRELLGGEGRRVEAGPGRVEAGPGRVEAGPGRVEAGPGRVEAGCVRAPARRSNSEDSIEVLSTTLIPDDLAAITEETEESPGNAAMEEHCTLAQEETHQQPEGCRANGQVKSQQLVPKLRLNLTPAVTPGAVTPGAVTLEALPLTSLERWSLSCPADEAIDCSSSPCSSEAPSLSSRHHGNAHQRRRRAGLRALRFLHQNSFSQHAVFCLLSGRPLLVIGGEERSVQRTVGALALYLPDPGRPGSNVQPCLGRPLSLDDLLTCRLIGIVRSPGTLFPSMHPSVDHYGRYVALLDLDHRTLRCPPYSGSLIGRLADPRSLIGRGSTYLLHLESCLTALANQAFVYTFSPALQRPSMLGEEEVVQAERRHHFLCGRGCSSQDDLKVMDFLSDLIKQRQTGSGPPVLRFSYSPTLLHKNTAG
ncbi:guanine nucleotide exchange protein smcr8b [Osmerus mordax]|uniref:guanine nucleotide exchange protein smcr8b n=1 Tax=Osmerus mordax TaxID=8014 RepID=UPI0035102CF6